MGRGEQRRCARRKAGIWPAGHLWKNVPVIDPLTNTEMGREMYCVDCGATKPVEKT